MKDFLEVEIDVTQQDIDKGKRRNARRCPVARALRRATGRRNCYVSNDVSVGDMYCSLPRRFSTFINTFDDYGRDEVKPFKTQKGRDAMTFLEILVFSGMALACICVSISSAVALAKDRSEEAEKW